MKQKIHMQFGSNVFHYLQHNLIITFAPVTFLPTVALCRNGRGFLSKRPEKYKCSSALIVKTF